MHGLLTVNWRKHSVAKYACMHVSDLELKGDQQHTLVWDAATKINVTCLKV